MRFDSEQIVPASDMLGCTAEELTLALKVGTAWVNAKAAQVAQQAAATVLREAMSLEDVQVPDISPAPEGTHESG